MGPCEGPARVQPEYHALQKWLTAENLRGSIRPEKSAAKSVAVGSFPSLTLMSISQAKAALTISVFLVSSIAHQWIPHRRLSATLAGLLPSGLSAYGFTRAGSIVEEIGRAHV